jgi:hypothetical protein
MVSEPVDRGGEVPRNCELGRDTRSGRPGPGLWGSRNRSAGEMPGATRPDGLLSKKRFGITTVGLRSSEVGRTVTLMTEGDPDEVEFHTCEGMASSVYRRARRAPGVSRGRRERRHESIAHLEDGSSGQRP